RPLPLGGIQNQAQTGILESVIASLSGRVAHKSTVGGAAPNPGGNFGCNAKDLQAASDRGMTPVWRTMRLGGLRHESGFRRAGGVAVGVAGPAPRRGELSPHPLQVAARRFGDRQAFGVALAQMDADQRACPSIWRAAASLFQRAGGGRDRRPSELTVELSRPAADRSYPYHPVASRESFDASRDQAAARRGAGTRHSRGVGVALHKARAPAWHDLVAIRN